MSSKLHEITPGRCRARNCSHGFYFDPVTFNVAVTPPDSVFFDSESPAKDADGVDEVSSGSCLLRLVPLRISLSDP